MKITGNTHRKPRACKGCGMLFRPRNRGGKGKGAGLFCSRECAWEKRSALRGVGDDWKHGVSDGLLRWANGWRVCRHCECDFLATLRPKKDAASEFCCERHRYLFQYGEIRGCAHCGVNISRNDERFRRVCNKCKRLRAKAHSLKSRIRRGKVPGRIHADRSELVFAKRVFERDRYHCWICLGICKPSYSHEDPASPTLEHVVPRSKGGAHAYDNCRCAHAICNSQKNDKC